MKKVFLIFKITGHGDTGQPVRFGHFSHHVVTVFIICHFFHHFFHHFVTFSIIFSSQILNSDLIEEGDFG